MPCAEIPHLLGTRSWHPGPRQPRCRGVGVGRVIAAVFWPRLLPSLTLGFTQHPGGALRTPQAVIPSEQNLLAFKPPIPPSGSSDRPHLLLFTTLVFLLSLQHATVPLVPLSVVCAYFFLMAFPTDIPSSLHAGVPGEASWPAPLLPSKPRQSPSPSPCLLFLRGTYQHTHATCIPLCSLVGV